MKRQNYGPRLGKLVFQLPGNVTLAYYLRLGLQNSSGSLGPEKLVKIVSCEKNWKRQWWGPKWNRWVATNIHLDQGPSRMASEDTMKDGTQLP